MSYYTLPRELKTIIQEYLIDTQQKQNFTLAFRMLKQLQRSNKRKSLKKIEWEESKLMRQITEYKGHWPLFKSIDRYLKPTQKEDSYNLEY